MGIWRLGGVDADYRRYLGLLLGIYSAFYAWLLVASNGLPFVMDANETYSAFWHAYNLYHFDFLKSFGITDESFSPAPEAHPFMHTHQGNMPRLFAFLIYVLGARSVESQIIVTTAVIGTLTVFLVFHYFAKAASPLFAFIFTTLLMTDYVLFAQWHLVTYRVWHGLLFFSAILALHEARDGNRRLWLGVLFVTYLLTFYYELVFAGLLTLTGLLYALYRYRGHLRGLLIAGGVSAAGAFAAILILAAQLVAVFGPAVAFRDFFITFIARNTKGAENALQVLKDFYEQHNIAFWFNIFDAAPYRSLGQIIKSVSTINFQTYTPVLTLASLIALAGWLLAAPVGRHAEAAWRLSRRPELRVFFPVLVLPALFALATLWLVAFKAQVHTAVIALFLAAGFGLVAAVHGGLRLSAKLPALRAANAGAAVEGLRIIAFGAAGVMALVLPLAMSRRTPDGALALVVSIPYLGFVLAALSVTAVAVLIGAKPRSVLALIPDDLPYAPPSRQMRRMVIPTLLRSALLAVPVVGFLLVWLAPHSPQGTAGLSLLAAIMAGGAGWFLTTRLRALYRVLRQKIRAAARKLALDWENRADQLDRRFRVVSASAALAVLPFMATSLLAVGGPGQGLPGKLILAGLATGWLTLGLIAVLPWLPRNFAAAVAGQYWGRDWRGTSFDVAAIVRILATGAALAGAFLVAVRGTVVFGATVDGSSVSNLAAMAVAITLAAGSLALYSRSLRGGWLDLSWLTWFAAIRVIALCGFAIGVAWSSPLLYEPAFESIWMEPVVNVPVRMAARLMVIVVLIMAGLAIVTDPQDKEAAGERGSLLPVMMLFGAGTLAYVVIYLLSPGYVLTGYQWRHTPFSVFTTNILPTLAFYLLARAVSAVPFRKASPASGGRPVVLQAVAGLGLTAGMVYWVALQIYYVNLLPPNHYAFLKDLAKEPFAGKTFAVNNYAAPVAIMTGDWAYYDPLISGGLVERNGENVAMVRDPKTYLWLADRYTNSDYMRPDYYICMTAQNFTTVLGKRTNNTLPTHRFYGCRWQGLVASVNNPSPVFRHRVVASDMKSDDYWTVLALDNNPPPVLETLPDISAPARIAPILAGSAEKPMLDLVYRSPDSVQGNDRIEVFVDDGDAACTDRPEAWRPLYKGPARKGIALPPMFTGHVVAFVTPRVSGKSGQRYNSPVLSVRRGMAAGTCGEGQPSAPVALALDATQSNQVEVAWIDAYGDGRTSLWAVLENGSVNRLLDQPRKDLHASNKSRHTFEGLPAEQIAHVAMQNCVDDKCSNIADLPLALGIGEIKREDGKITIKPARSVSGLEYSVSGSRQLDGELDVLGTAIGGKPITFVDPAPGVDLVLRLENCRDGQCYARGKPFLVLSSNITARAQRRAEDTIAVTWNKIDRSYEYWVELFDGISGKAMARNALPLDASEYRFGSLDPQKPYRINLRYCRKSLCQNGQQMIVPNTSSTLRGLR